MSSVLFVYLIGAVIWGGVSYGLLGGFWWGRAGATRAVAAAICGALWFPSWAMALYREVRS